MGKYKNILLLAGIFAVLTGGYVFFFGGEDEAALTTERVSGAQAVLGADVLQKLQELKAVRLEGRLFSDPAFISLRDFSQQLVPQPIGRSNPFAPIGVERVPFVESSPPPPPASAGFEDGF